MTLFLQSLTEGLVLGSTYALVALGFTLVFGVLGVLNVAHPDFYMAGGYATWYVLGTVGGGIGMGFVTAIAVGIIAAIVLYYVVLKRIPSDQPMGVFIATLGISMFLQNVIARVVGPDDRSFPALLPVPFHHVGLILVSDSEILVLGLMVGLVLALFWWIGRTSMGREIRAVSENRRVARMLGVNVSLVMITTLVVACVIAGVTGFVFGNLYGAINPFMAQPVALKMFVVSLVAGAGSFRGAVSVGLALGVLEALTASYIGSSWQDMGGLVALVAVLFLRPQGLFGSPVRAS